MAIQYTLIRHEFPMFGMRNGEIYLEKNLSAQIFMISDLFPADFLNFHEWTTGMLGDTGHLRRGCYLDKIGNNSTPRLTILTRLG